MDNTPTALREDGPDEAQIELLQRSIELKRQILALSKECGIAFYRPHWLQHRFHAAREKRRGLFAGNRFGKSKCNAAETVAWMLGERPWYKTPFDIYDVRHVKGRNREVFIRHHHEGGDSHPLVRQGIPPWPTKQIIVCTNWKKVDEIWTNQSADRPGKLWELLPKGFAKRAVRNHEGVISEVYGENGSLLQFMSVDAFKRNPQVAESSDHDRVGLDEPAPVELWKGAARGLVDRNGQGDFTLTSLEEVWIYDYFNQAELSISSPDVCADRTSFQATIWDNPHLSDEAILRFEQDLSEEEKECRLEGRPLELVGLIYKEFSRDKHVLVDLPDGWRDWHLPQKECVLHARVDTHPVKPNAVLFAAVGPSEIPIVCNEIYSACDADTLCETINEYVKQTGLFLAGIKCEPAAWIKDPSNRSVSIASRFAAHGLFPRPASKDLDNGILITKSCLKRGRLFFTPTCRRTFWEMSRYRYNPETGKPVDKDDHMMENLRRFCIDEPLRWFDPDKADGFPIEDEPFQAANLSTNY